MLAGLKVQRNVIGVTAATTAAETVINAAGNCNRRHRNPYTPDRVGFEERAVRSRWTKRTSFKEKWIFHDIATRKRNLFFFFLFVDQDPSNGNISIPTSRKKYSLFIDCKFKDFEYSKFVEVRQVPFVKNKFDNFRDGK